MFKVLYFITWTILIIDSIFVILLVLAQESKSQGLGGLGGGMDMSFAGHTQRTAKRLTAIGGVILLVCIIGVILLMKPAGSSNTGTLQTIKTTPPPPSVEAPAQPVQPGQPGAPVMPAGGR